MFYLRVLTITLLLTVSGASTVSAQLFGDRDISRNRKRGPKNVESAATVTGSEKFFRGNRTIQDFVGAGDTTTSTFVGSSQAPTTTATTRSVTGLAEETAPQVNVPRRRRATGIYNERLTVGFGPRNQDGIRLPSATTLSRQLSQIADDRGFQIQLSPGDSMAKLSGTVASERKKRIAELLVLFEPGIETVTNELRVEPKASP